MARPERPRLRKVSRVGEPPCIEVGDGAEEQVRGLGFTVVVADQGIGFRGEPVGRLLQQPGLAQFGAADDQRYPLGATAAGSEVRDVWLTAKKPVAAVVEWEGAGHRDLPSTLEDLALPISMRVLGRSKSD